jgi:hypothetical protein
MEIEPSSRPQKKSEISKENPALTKSESAGFLNESRISFHRGPHSNRRDYALVAWSLVSLAIDWLMMFALVAGVFVVLRFFLTEIPAETLKLLFGVCWVGAYVVYHLVLRVFLGFTLGDWAVGLRLGEVHQRLSFSFAAAVQLRFLVVVATGVVLLPLLSALTGRDWPGRLSGLPLTQVLH